MIRSALTAALVLAAPACLAQGWGPTSAADPWGPHGSQMCSAPAGDPERFCMAVFCTEPGGPLTFGYSNAAQGGEGDWDVSVSVDRLSDWPMTLSMQPGFGHAVGVAALDPGRYPGLYQSIRAGSWLYLDLGGDELGLILRRSNAEMQRLEDVCAPVRPLETDEIEITLIGPRRPDGPPEVIAVLDREGPLRFDLPFARLVVTAGGSGPAVARLRSHCEVPAAAQPEPTAPAAPETGGIVPLNLADAPLAISDGEVDRTLQTIHGEMIDAYRNATGTLPEEARYVVHEFPAGAVAFSQLCGGAGWFGPRGCMGFVHARGNRGWVEVCSDNELPYGRSVALDMGSLSEGWPDILVDGGAVRWRHVDREYRLIQ